ncbi:MAG: GNAT family N-acetyltransferase [Planctomycetota bacterium]|jgi:predicted GNAT family N-acyltransferase
MDISCTLEPDLTAEQKQEIRELQYAAFPSTDEFATQRWYHSPPTDEDTWFAARIDGELIGSVRLLFREISTDAGDLVVGGIGNVCSHPAHRGSGAAKACLMAAAGAIQRDADFGLLSCGEPVRPFYESLGWQAIKNQLRYRPGTAHAPLVIGVPSDYAMILPGRKSLDDWPAGEIDLNGPDW